MATTIQQDPFVAVDERGDIEIDLTDAPADPFGPVSSERSQRDLIPPGRWYEFVWPTLPVRAWLYALIAAASLVTLIALANGLTGEPTCVDCDAVQRVGVSRSLTTDAYAIRFASCKNEAIRRVSVRDADSGTVYWSATASPPLATDSVVIGQATGAMVETVPLSAPLPTGELVAVVEADSTHVLSFRTANVRPNKVYWDGLVWSSSGFKDAVRATGGCADWIGPLGSSGGSAIQWGILLGALGIAGLAATRLGREEPIGLDPVD